MTGIGYVVRGDRRETLGPLDLVRLEDGDLVTGSGQAVRIEITRETVP